MYLNSVLQGILSEKRPFSAEDLYKLNEAVFNLPEEDTVDARMCSKLYQALQKMVKAYEKGTHDTSDPNFFYDYVALLATMQNQHFFSEKQNKQLLAWLAEAVAGEEDPPARAPAKPSAATTKEIARLEKENEALTMQLEKLKAVASAVQVLKTFKPPSPLVTAEPKAKAKAKAKPKAKAPGKERSPEVKAKLDEMRDLRKTLREEGKSAEEIKAQLDPLNEELKVLKKASKGPGAAAPAEGEAEEAKEAPAGEEEPAKEPAKEA